MPNSTINLTRGMPPADVFPVEDLVRCSAAALRNDAAVLLQYGRSPGYQPLREWLAAHHGVQANQILVGNSSMEIVTFIAQTWLQPGEKVFVEVPCYDRAITTSRRVGAEVVGIPLTPDGFDMEAFEAALAGGKPKLAYVVPDFQNPMGITTSLAKRQRLVELARRHDFWIIEDAPYRPLRYWGEEVQTMLSMAPERVIHLSSFSKTLAPGMRLGYAIAPADVIANLANWAVDTYIGPVFPTQGIVYEYCKAGLLEPNLAALKKLYAPRLRATLDALAKHMPNTTWSKPEGGFYVGVTLPEGTKMAELLPKAAAAGLKLSDGRGFYPNPAEGDRFLRIPFCSLTPAEIDAGVARLAELV